MKAPDVVRVTWPELVPVNNLIRSTNEIDSFDHGGWGYAWAVLEGRRWLDDATGKRLRAWLPWLAAVAGHHGEYPVAGILPGDFAAEDVLEHDRCARSEWIQEIAALFLTPAGLGLENSPPACSEAAKALLAGFCSVCDWIGSNIGVSPYAVCRLDLPLADYLNERVWKIKEERRLETFGLVNQSRPFAGLGRLLQADESPRGVQVLVHGLPLAPCLTLVEAPTGSGKTEAALAYAWRLLDAGLADSIVFALPTQATANAMLARAEAFGGLVWLAGANVVLAHGKRRLSEAFQKLVDTARTRTAQGRTEAGAQCAEWLAASRKRVFLGQVGVGTVDQVLLSVLPVRHKFVRGFGLARSVLIVDEVHAYDAYMHGLLAEVLRRQKAAGGSAILLSATLPAGVRDKLFAAWEITGPAQAAYPVVWWGDGSDAQAREVPADQRPEPREVFTESLSLPGAEPDEPLLGRIVAAADAGARVAVVCNLVDVAQRLARRLRERSPHTVDVFHARYRFADRQDKEAAVLKLYGRHALRDGGRILVATQVVEQSLDLDFDWMITQVCPVDLLFQRLGRLHRHKRPESERPTEFSAPRCTVLTAEGDDYGLHKLIYGNTRVLWRTQRMLEGTGSIEFPAAYRAWIEAVYEREDWADEPETVCRDFDEWWARQRAAVTEAEQWINTPRKPFRDDDEGIAIKTRDGEMSLSVLALRDDGRLLDGGDSQDDQSQAHLVRLELNTIPVPASWRDSLRACERDEDGRYLMAFTSNGAGGWVARVGKTGFRYMEEFGLEREKDGSAD